MGSKAHKIFYQPSYREKPWALEICAFCDYPKIYDVECAVYHPDLPNRVRSYYFTCYKNFADTFLTIWNETLVSLSETYENIELSHADYQLVFSEFQKLLESTESMFNGRI